jgi:hypothetical protein
MKQRLILSFRALLPAVDRRPFSCYPVSMLKRDNYKNITAGLNLARFLLSLVSNTHRITGLALLLVFFTACMGEQSPVPYYPSPDPSLKTTISGTVDVKEEGSPVTGQITVTVCSTPAYSSNAKLGSAFVSAGSYSLEIPRPAAAQKVYFFVSYASGSVASFVKVGEADIPAGAETAAYNIVYNRQLTTVSGNFAVTINSGSPVGGWVYISSSPGGYSSDNLLGSAQVTSSSGTYAYSVKITRPETDVTVYFYTTPAGLVTPVKVGETTISADAENAAYNISKDIETTTISGTFDYKENGQPVSVSQVYVADSPSYTGAASSGNILGQGAIYSGNYTATILRPTSAVTVYFYVRFGSSNLYYVKVGETTIPAEATATYNISFDNTNVTTLSGTFTYKENGSSATLYRSVDLYAISNSDILGTAGISLMDSPPFTYTISFPKRTVTATVYVYALSGLNNDVYKNLGSVRMGPADNTKTLDLTWDRQVTRIHGTISGSGASGLNGDILSLSTRGDLTTLLSSELSSSGEMVGYETAFSGSYDITIDRLEAAAVIYFYKMVTSGSSSDYTYTFTKLTQVSISPSDTDKEHNFTVD